MAEKKRTVIGRLIFFLGVLILALCAWGEEIYKVEKQHTREQ